MNCSRYQITKEFIKDTSTHRPGDVLIEIMNFSDAIEAIDWQARVNKAAENGETCFRIPVIRFLKKVSI